MPSRAVQEANTVHSICWQVHTMLKMPRIALTLVLKLEAMAISEGQVKQPCRGVLILDQGVQNSPNRPFETDLRERASPARSAAQWRR